MVTVRYGSAIYSFDGLSFHKSKYRGREKPIYFASKALLASNEVYLAFREARFSAGYWATAGQLLLGMWRAARTPRG